MKINWPWKKKLPKPDISVIIDYFSDSKSLIVHCWPLDLDNEQVLGFMDLAADLIDAEGLLELNGYEDLEEFLLGREPVKSDKVKGHLRLVKR